MRSKKEESSFYLNNRGVELTGKKKYKAAVKSFREALNIEGEPGSPLTWFNLGMALFYKGDEPASTEEAFRKSISIDPDKGDTYLQLGLHLYNEKRYDEAEGIYKSGIDKEPEHSMLWNNLGVLFFVTGKYQDAAEAFKKAVKFDDKNVDAWFNLADTLDELNLPEEASAAREKFRSLNG